MTAQQLERQKTNMTDDSPHNPLSTWWSDVAGQIPLVTRCITGGLIIFGLVFMLLGRGGLIIGSTPAFVFDQWELHRCLVSHWFSTGLLSTLISAWIVFSIGARIETSRGSLHFAAIACVQPILINMLFVTLFESLSLISSSPALQLMKAQGYWGAIMMLTVIDCAMFPALPRKLFVWGVPTQYYPAAQCALLLLLSSFAAEVPLGYGVGLAYNALLPRARAAVEQYIEALERSSAFRSLVNAPGFVSLASGSEISRSVGGVGGSFGAAGGDGGDGGGGGDRGGAAAAADPWRQHWEHASQRTAMTAEAAELEEGQASGEGAIDLATAADPATAAATRESRRAAVAAAAQRRAAAAQ
jgi:hypothetical protein